MKTICVAAFLLAVVMVNGQSKTRPAAKSGVAAVSANAKNQSAEKVAEPEKETITKVTPEPGKEVIAIYPFSTASGYDYEYAQSVGNAVESGFVRSTRFTVVERSRFGTLKNEEKFREVNTTDVVKTAAKFGAKYIVTGHITGANTGELYDSQNKFDGYQTSISVAFKIIEVETGQIKISESLNLAGRGGSKPLSIGNAYSSIDGITRRIIAANFPQRFPFMSILRKDTKKKEEYVAAIKIWGGSDHGLKVGDMVEVYTISEIVNPATKKKVEEKQFVAAAEVTAINSGTTSSCDVYKASRYGKALLQAINENSEKVVIEYTGGQKPKSFWDSL